MSYDQLVANVQYNFNFLQFGIMCETLTKKIKQVKVDMLRKTDFNQYNYIHTVELQIF